MAYREIDRRSAAIQRPPFHQRASCVALIAPSWDWSDRRKGTSSITRLSCAIVDLICTRAIAKADTALSLGTFVEHEQRCSAIHSAKTPLYRTGTVRMPSKCSQLAGSSPRCEGVTTKGIDPDQLPSCVRNVEYASLCRKHSL